MTVQEWLTKHDISVEFYIRGFRFESFYGATHQQVLFSGKMPKTFVTFSDVATWIYKNPEYVTQAALEDLHAVYR